MKLNSSIENLKDYIQNLDLLSLNIYNTGSSFEDIRITCNISFAFIDYIQIYSKKRLTLDNSLNLTGLNIIGSTKPILLVLFNLIGIDIKTETFSFLANEYSEIYFFIDYSKFDLYSKGKLLTNDDCKKSYYDKVNFFTNIKRFNFGYDTIFGQNKICPYLFNNSQLTELSIFSHTNSFIKKNMFEFLEINETVQANTIQLNEFRYFFIYMHFDSVSSKIINPYAFKNIEQIRLYGYILNIQYDVFKNLNSLNMITINTIKIRTLFHNGNDWLDNLRFSDGKSSTNKMYDFPSLLLILVNDYQPNTLTHLYEYLDEDFCLFSNFPHEKLVYPLIQPGKNVLINCSCTLLYLIRNHNLYFYIDKIINEIYPDGVEDLANVYCKLELVAHECDLSSRLSKCNSSKSRSSRHLFYWLSRFQVTKIMSRYEILDKKPKVNNR
jgi:hypothetical protein